MLLMVKNDEKKKKWTNALLHAASYLRNVIDT